MTTYQDIPIEEMSTLHLEHAISVIRDRGGISVSESIEAGREDLPVYVELDDMEIELSRRFI